MAKKNKILNNLPSSGNSVDDLNSPSFEIKKMPKGYKTGRFKTLFSSNKNNKKNKSDIDVSQAGSDHAKNKKIGIVIISIGVLVVLFLVYLMLSYFNIGTNLFTRDNNGESANNLETTTNRNTNNPPLEDESNTINEDNLEEEEEDVINDEELVFEDENEEEIIEEDDQLDEEPIENVLFIDTDGDGLSDSEEAVLATNSLVRDTDGDGFDDLTEFLGLYNPSGPGVLLDNPGISEYVNDSFSYSVYYSNNWDLNALIDGSSAMFLIDDLSYIQILVEENSFDLGIEDWYANRFFETPEMALALEKSGSMGVFGSDLYSFYIQSPENGNIYSIIYSFPENSPATYRNFFRMMVNSFEFL